MNVVACRDLKPGDVFKDSVYRHKTVVVSGEPWIGQNNVIVPILQHGETWLRLNESVEVLGTATNLAEATALKERMQ